MKKISVCILTALLFSCSDGTDKTTTGESAPGTAPIENVNGNVPDTTNSISPDNTTKVPDSSHLKDSLRKDSARRQ